jgi:hypothetical protein
VPYDIAALTRQEALLAQSITDHFVQFFNEHNYETDTRAVVTCDVGNLIDIERLHYGPGLYVIFTDYQRDMNPCTLESGGLKAIYRGHCYTMKKRLFSHLLNDHYRATLPERGFRYDVCMKLDEANGINIDQQPYCEYRWRVVVYKMPGSSKLIREQAELAFDQVFGRPLGSREVVVRDA